MTYEERQEARGRAIIDAVNERAKLKLEYLKRLEGLVFHAKDKKGKDYIIVAYGPWPVDRLIVRSVLKRRGRCRMRYLTNGQASTGSIQVKFWNEGDMVVDDPAGIRGCRQPLLG